MKNLLSFKGIFGLVVILFATSFTTRGEALAYTPEGTWEYNAPGVPAGYQTGNIVIVETETGYGVSIAFNEYFQVTGENVTYNKKEIRFTVYVEGESILLTGTFKKDTFTGTVEYSEGSFDITATRVEEE